MMTEQELFAFMAGRADVSWDVFQFWTGITFAYMAVGYFAVRNLNWTIIAVLSVLYTALTVVVALMAENNNDVLEGLTRDLIALSHTTEISSASKAWIAGQSKNSILQVAILIATFGTFFSALIYLPYNYVRSRKDAT